MSLSLIHIDYLNIQDLFYSTLKSSWQKKNFAKICTYAIQVEQLQIVDAPLLESEAFGSIPICIVEDTRSTFYVWSEE